MAMGVNPQVVRDGRLFQLDTDMLEFGVPIPGSIYTPDGAMLVRCGRVLKPNALLLLGDRVNAGLFGDSAWPDRFLRTPRVEAMVRVARSHARRDENAPAPSAVVDAVSTVTAQDLAPLPIDALHIGKCLSFNIFNASGDEILGAGQTVSHGFIAGLRRSGLSQVHVPKSAIARRTVYENAASKHRVARELDEVVQSLTKSEMTLGRSLRARRDLGMTRLAEETERGLRLQRKSLDKVAEFTEDLYRGRLTTVAPATDVVTQFLDMVNLDSSLLPVVAMYKRAPGDYLFQQALNASLLSIAVAAELSVRRENLLQIGVAALLQDVGMLKVPDEIRMAPRELTPRERDQVAMHPLHSLDIVRDLDGLGRLSLLICYQSHEQAGGGGYPRRRRSELTHPYARLVGTVSAYTAMSSDRPYRPAMSPYKAMETLLREAGASRFDRAVVRTVLDCVSLFPLGSVVRLSDGGLARVLRASPGCHTKPVIVRIDAQGADVSDEIDLSQQSEVHVVQALAAIPEDEPIQGAVSVGV